MEDKIWDLITNKAKARFDFKTFAKDLSELGEDYAENILFEIILGFASGEDEKTIAAKLHNEFLMSGFIWDKKEIDVFLIGKKDVMRLEIYATRLANNLLRDGNEPAVVLQSVNKLLN